MKRFRRRKDPGEPATTGGVSASQGSNAAGRDVVGSVAMHIESATLAPAEAYQPISADAVPNGLCKLPRVQLFVGRSTELDALDVALAESGEVVLRTVSGLGGVGKTALAACWATHRATARVRWWITADSKAAIDAGLAELARALQPAVSGLPIEIQTERAMAWLASTTDWLLILDNVDHPDHVRQLLDRCALSAGRVLITTRRATGWHQLATTVRLGVFVPDESAELFTRILSQDGPREADGVDDVCAELGHLALAVEQAAAYCHEAVITPRAYLDMLRQWPAETYSRGPEGSNVERTVARIWRITLDRLADTPLAGQILRILAWYAPDHIPRALLDGLASPPELATAVGRLLAYSMVTRNDDGTLSVHRLVQAFARTPQTDDPHRSAADIDHARNTAASQLGRAFPTDVEAPTHWPQCRELLPHIDAYTESCDLDLDSLGTSFLLDRAASFQQGQGALGHAIHYFLRALSTCHRILGEDHLHTLVLRGNLAGAYDAAGDLQRAIPLYEQTLADCIRVLGENHPTTLVSSGNLAKVYDAAGDLQRAISLHEQTLDAHLRLLGEDHPDTLVSRNNLAAAYHAADDPQRAIPLLEKTLAARIQLLGEGHPHTLASRNNLAGAYMAAGDLQRATPLYEQTLDAHLRLLGEDHPDTLLSRNNLGAAYHAAGDLQRAIPLLEKTLAARIQLLDEDHPHTLASRNNLAGAYMAAGDLQRATPLYEQTLADCVRVLSEDHPTTLVSRNNLAVVYQRAGDVQRAIPLFKDILAARIRLLGEGHPHTLVSRYNLAGAYQAAGETQRATSLFEQALVECERFLGPENPLTRRTREHVQTARIREK